MKNSVVKYLWKKERRAFNEGNLEEVLKIRHYIQIRCKHKKATFHQYGNIRFGTCDFCYKDL